MKDLKYKSEDTNQISDELQICSTDDGSISLKSTKYKERFHSNTGAKKEAQEKFVNTSNIQRFKKGQEICVLDVCFGMGYNTATLMEELEDKQIFMTWWGLEIDKRPLEIALRSSTFKTNWSKRILTNLKSIQNSNQFLDTFYNGQIIWGDARKTLRQISPKIKFDLIFHDAFSPKQCPELWSEEFLTGLANKLSKDGRIITYSRAAAIRASLRRSGLVIKSILPTDPKTLDWSIGTIAIRRNSKETDDKSNKFTQPLLAREEEHLETIAAVPYRDPTGDSLSHEIKKIRAYEQSNSSLKATNSWKEKWGDTKIE